MSHDIETLHVRAVAVRHDDTETIAELLSTIAGMEQRIREVKAAFRQHLLEEILAAGKDITVGTKRFYAGYPADYEKQDKRAILEAALAETGGDLDTVAELLGSDPFKPGACRGVLTQETFGRLFRKVEKAVLKEGKAKKELIDVDTRFLK